MIPCPEYIILPKIKRPPHSLRRAEGELAQQLVNRQRALPNPTNQEIAVVIIGV
jgi:hypothetical protein